MDTVSRGVSLTDQAVESIRRAVIAGDLVPDRLYTGSELARQLGVSRTPIREALQVLSRRGMVRIEKNRGVRVVNTSVRSLIEVFQVRLMLEVPMSRRATQLKTDSSSTEFEAAVDLFREAAESGEPDAVLRADRDFHRALMAGAGNDKARELLQEQRDFVLSTGVGTVPTSRTAMECFEDHADIIAAYRQGDSVAVGRAVSRHIANTARILIRQETRNRPEFGEVDADEAIDWLTNQD